LERSNLGIKIFIFFIISQFLDIKVFTNVVIGDFHIQLSQPNYQKLYLLLLFWHLEIQKYVKNLWKVLQQFFNPKSTSPQLHLIQKLLETLPIPLLNLHDLNQLYQTKRVLGSF
jgi:hypothetical protein